jgi:hypothetical protein
MKKAIKILGTVLCAVVLFFNLSINGKSSTGDTNLSVLLNKADAECEQGEIPEMNKGKCYQISGNCFWNPDYDECDPTAF